MNDKACNLRKNAKINERWGQILKEEGLNSKDRSLVENKYKRLRKNWLGIWGL